MVAGGVESMSRALFVMSKAATASSRLVEMFDPTIGWRFVNKRFAFLYGMHSMPETAEFCINRADHGVFALRSQKRAASALEQGRFAMEITPVEVRRRKGSDVIIEHDEHIRP